MRNEIKNGNVYDVDGTLITDPETADKLVRKGNITYEQARNIAKPGNIESLKFDAKNNIISTVSCLGISYLISFARYSWDDKDFKDAARAALSDALTVGGVAFVTGVVSSQLLRTKTASAITLSIRPSIKRIYSDTPFELGKKTIETIAKASLGKTVSGAAAINHVSKLLKSNVITAGVTTVASMTPDFYRALFAKTISWGQFTKNLLTQIGGVAGGTGGWIGGAATGASIGSFIPVIGTTAGSVIGGIGGALAGGAIGTSATKNFLNFFAKDDAEEMLDIVRFVIEDLAYEYLLSESEMNEVMREISLLVTSEWLRKMYSVLKEEKDLLGMEGTSHVDFATNELRIIFEKINNNRNEVFIDEKKIEIFILDTLDDNITNESSSTTDESSIVKSFMSSISLLGIAEENTNTEINVPKEKTKSEIIYEIIYDNLVKVVDTDKNNLYLKGYSKNFSSKKLKNGMDALWVACEDDIFAYYDTTLFGKGDLGFVLTEDCLHHKESFSSTKYIHYFEMRKITTQPTSFKVYENFENPCVSCCSSKVRDAVANALNEICRYLKNK